MVLFIFLNLILLFIFLFLLVLFSMFWPPDSPWAPWWRTNNKTAKAICKLAKINSKDIIYDLGCGDGEVLLYAAKEYRAQGVGIEIDWPRLAIAKIRVIKNKLTQLINLKRGNFFKYDLSRATVINVYLVPQTLKRLKPKFIKELKPGTRIISYKYEADFKKIGEDKKNKLFLYEI